MIENVLNRKDLILWKTKDRLKGVVCQHDNDRCGELYSLCHWSLGSEEMVSLWAKSSLHTGAGMTKLKEPLLLDVKDFIQAQNGEPFNISRNTLSTLNVHVLWHKNLS